MLQKMIHHPVAGAAATVLVFYLAFELANKLLDNRAVGDIPKMLGCCGITVAMCVAVLAIWMPG